MNITLTYSRIDSKEQEVVELNPQEYFDPLEKGENYWDDGVERKFLLEEYLPIDKVQVKWFRITLEHDEMKRIYTCQLLDSDRSTSTHSIDEFGNEEIITQSKIADETWHTVRTQKPLGGQWSTYMDNISSDKMVEGKYANENLITNWTFDETIEFSHAEKKDR